MPDWPTKRGKRGANSRAGKEPKHNQSMTALACETGAPFHDGCDLIEEYDPVRKMVVRRWRKDKSLTQQLGLTVWDRRKTLLKRSNPFGPSKDIKEQSPTTGRIDYEIDSLRYDSNRQAPETVEV